MAGLALWERGHHGDVCLEQNKVPLSGSFARVLFVLREGGSGKLTTASHLSWTVLSIWIAKLICHFLLNTRGGQGSRSGPQVTALEGPGWEGWPTLPRSLLPPLRGGRMSKGLEGLGLYFQRRNLISLRQPEW